MRILNLLCGGDTGGIEVLCLEYSQRSSLDNRYLMLWKAGVISREMQRLGVPAEIYDTAPSRYAKDFLRFLKKCREEKIDTVVFHQTSPLIALCVLGCKFRYPRIHILGYVHSDLTSWAKKELYGAKVAFSCAEKIVCISHTVMNSIKRLPGVNAKSVLVFNGTDVERFAASRHKPSRERLEIAYVGRLHEQKGVENILNGLSELPKGIPFRLQIAGDGAHRPYLESLCDNLDIRDRVEFLGTCRDIPKLYRNADVFIHLPNCEEGFGLTIVEAMAAGLVCIGNSRGAIPEIIQDGENGFIVSKEKPLAAVLEKIWNDGEALDTIRDAAMKTAQEFGIEKNVCEIDELLRSCMEL